MSSTVLMRASFGLRRKTLKQFLPSLIAGQKQVHAASSTDARIRRLYNLTAGVAAHQRRLIAGSSRLTYCQQEKERWTDLSYEQLTAQLEARDIYLIDVREVKEIESTGRIPESINIPLSEIKEALSLEEDGFRARYKCEKPQKTATNLVFYGLCQVKSSAALEIAQKAGYKKARHFPGGFEEWSKRAKQSPKKATASGS